MSHKHEIVKWQKAVDAFESDDAAEAINIFLDCTDIGAKVFFNMGMIYTSLDRHEDAIISFTNAIFQDKYLSVAYFQRGVSQWLTKDYAAALDSFTDTIEFLRDNMTIDYNQLGLAYKLYSCEAFFNRALCFLALGDEENAKMDLAECEKDAVLSIHQQEKYTSNAVMKAYADGKLKKYLPFVVPKGLLYKPHEHKVSNAKEVDYLGSGKVIASITEGDDFVGFNGPRKIAAMGGMTIEEMREKERARDHSNEHHTSEVRRNSAEAPAKQPLSERARRAPVTERRPSEEKPAAADDEPKIADLKIDESK
eukprot:Partr_v1_DN27975_c2_g1_i1_m11440 putative NADPH oxidase activator 1